MSSRGEVVGPDLILEWDSHCEYGFDSWNGFIDQRWTDPLRTPAHPTTSQHDVSSGQLQWCTVVVVEVNQGSIQCLMPLFLQTVTEVPPWVPTPNPLFFVLGLFLFFLVTSFCFISPNRPMSSSSACVFLFVLFLVGLFFQDSAKASYAPSPPPSTPSFLTHVWIISMRYFWVLFNFHMTVESVQLLFVYYSYSLMIC